MSFRQRRIKNWCITITLRQAGQDHSQLFTEADKDDIHYAVWQEEKGNNSTVTNPIGYKHIQGYVEFQQPRTFDQATEYFGPDAHIEIPKKCRQACISYCKKEDTRVSGPWEYGDPTAKRQGQRTDMEDIKESLDRGATVSSIASDHFSSWCRYRKSFDEYIELLRPFKPGRDRDGQSPIHVIVVWGSSGTGKSRFASLHDPTAYRPIYKRRDDTSFWERYRGENCVVFDDFTDSQLSLQEFCQITDPYPVLLNAKFGSARLKATEFIFTSNVDPTYWWNSRDAEEALPQVHRRIDHVFNLEKTSTGAYQSVTFTPCKKCSGWENIDAAPVEPNEENISDLLDEITRQNVMEKHVIDLSQDE